MKAVLKVGATLLLASSLLAQTAAPAKKTARKPVSNSAADIQALKDAVAAQQQQIQTLQQQLQQTNQQLQQSSQQYQTTQQQLQQAQQAAADAQAKATALESSVAQKDSVDKLNAQYADIQTTLTNNAVSAQDEQKRMSGLEATLGRFRWTGDVRVRGEDFFQGYTGCTACADRNRARIRVRFGFEGKLNDDFTAGVALASTFPQARSVAEWLRHGWHVALSYVLGFAILLLVLGWHPDALHKASVAPSSAASGH